MTTTTALKPPPFASPDDVTAAVEATGDRLGLTVAQRTRVETGVDALRIVALAGATITYEQFADIVGCGNSGSGAQLFYIANVCKDAGRDVLGCLVVGKRSLEVTIEGFRFVSDEDPAVVRARVWASYGAVATPTVGGQA